MRRPGSGTGSSARRPPASPRGGPPRAEPPARGAVAPAPPRAGDVPDGFVLLGEIGRAHGLKGEVRLKSYTGEPAAIASYGPLTTEDGRRLTLASVRPAGAEPDILVARIEGIATREAAEALVRTRLHVARAALGEPEEDEFYLADLVGLEAEDEAGLTVGRVVAVPDFGGGEMLEIAPAAGPRRTVLLPFAKAFVPIVDIAGRRIVIAPPQGWLAEPGHES